MLEKISVSSIIKSIYLGMGIGLVLQLLQGRMQDLRSFVIVILVSGVIGLIIGAVTEFVTAILPITLANPQLYFLINNIVALIVSFSLFKLWHFFIGKDLERTTVDKFLFFILGIIALANLVDYLFYLRANKKLNIYLKKKL